MPICIKKYFCAICGRRFRTAGGLKDHRRVKGHLEVCQDCGQGFADTTGLRTHQRDTKHCFCAPCDQFFNSKDSLSQHQKSPVHVSQFRCCLCERDFVNGHALQQHLTYKVHREIPPTPATGFNCDLCDRSFSSTTSLQQHKASPIHKPLASLECVEPSCKTTFNCPSALIQHLESGKCCSGLNRQKLNSMVHKNDTERVITSHQISLQTSSVPPEKCDSVSVLSSPTGTPILTPGTWSHVGNEDDIDLCSLASENLQDLVQISLPLENLALDGTRRFNSIPLTCHICSAQGDHLRIFRTTKALEDHIGSPVHDIKAFRCPQLLFPPQKSNASSPIKSFNTLSGLIQHLEAGACRGGRETFWKTMGFLRQGVLPLQWRGKLFLQ